MIRVDTMRMVRGRVNFMASLLLALLMVLPGLAPLAVSGQAAAMQSSAMPGMADCHLVPGGMTASEDGKSPHSMASCFCVLCGTAGVSPPPFTGYLPFPHRQPAAAGYDVATGVSATLKPRLRAHQPTGPPAV